MEEKIKKPIYKKWWFWVTISIIVLFCLIPTDDTSNTSNNQITPTSIIENSNIIKENVVVNNEIKENNVVEESKEEIQKPKEEPEKIEEIKETPKVEEVKNDYILNKNTKVFHYYGCNSVRKMKDKNKQEITATRNEMINRGYKPCGNCKP